MESQFLTPLVLSVAAIATASTAHATESKAVENICRIDAQKYAKIWAVPQ